MKNQLLDHQEIINSCFKPPQEAIDDLQKHKELFPLGFITSDCSTLLDKYGTLKVYQAIDTSLNETGKNHAEILSHYPEYIENDSFEYFSLQITISNKETGYTCEELLKLRDELIYIYRSQYFQFVNKLMVFDPFIEELAYDNNSLEMMTLTNLINNLDLDFNGTVEHIKVDQFKNRQLLSFQLPMYIRSQARSLFETNFLNKKDKIVKEYDPVILYTQPPGKKGQSEIKDYVCYFIVDLYSGQVPKRRIITTTTTTTTKRKSTKTKANSGKQKNILDKCTSKVVSRCRFCAYCRAITHTKYQCPFSKPCTKCGIKGHKTSSCKNDTLTAKEDTKNLEKKQYFPPLPNKEVQRYTEKESIKSKTLKEPKREVNILLLKKNQVIST